MYIHKIRAVKVPGIKKGENFIHYTYIHTEPWFWFGGEKLSNKVGEREITMDKDYPFASSISIYRIALHCGKAYTPYME
jgi:hypothetical protein